MKCQFHYNIYIIYNFIIACFIRVSWTLVACRTTTCCGSWPYKINKQQSNIIWKWARSRMKPSFNPCEGVTIMCSSCWHHSMKPRVPVLCRFHKTSLVKHWRWYYIVYIGHALMQWVYLTLRVRLCSHCNTLYFHE